MSVMRQSNTEYLSIIALTSTDRRTRHRRNNGEQGIVCGLKFTQPGAQTHRNCLTRGDIKVNISLQGHPSCDYPIACAGREPITYCPAHSVLLEELHIYQYSRHLIQHLCYISISNQHLRRNIREAALTSAVPLSQPYANSALGVVPQHSMGRSVSRSRVPSLPDDCHRPSAASRSADGGRFFRPGGSGPGGRVGLPVGRVGRVRSVVACLSAVTGTNNVNSAQRNGCMTIMNYSIALRHPAQFTSPGHCSSDSEQHRNNRTHCRVDHPMATTGTVVGTANRLQGRRSSEFRRTRSRDCAFPAAGWIWGVGLDYPYLVQSYSHVMLCRC